MNLYVYCLYVYEFTYVCMSVVSDLVDMSSHGYTRYIYSYVCMYVCVAECFMYVCLYVCMCVCKCMYFVCPCSCVRCLSARLSILL